MKVISLFSGCGGVDLGFKEGGFDKEELVLFITQGLRKDIYTLYKIALRLAFRKKGMKAKDFVEREVEKLYDTKRWCKMTTRGNWDKRNIDMYDGLVMSLFEKKS